MLSKFVRGMVYYANIPNVIYAPKVQSGRRPVIIISNDVGNVFSQNVTIVPCTSNTDKKDSQPTHVTTRLINDTESIVLCENIMTIDKSYLEMFVGMLDDYTMDKITDAIGIALGFTKLKINDKCNNPKNEPKLVVTGPTGISKDDPKGLEDSIDRSKKSEEFMKKFIEDTRLYGVSYMVKKYGISSTGAVYQRCMRYKKLLDTK